MLLRLVDQSDVLVEGFRPGVAERLGFGPEVCCGRNVRARLRSHDRLGQTGRSRRAGHDINYLALSGLLHQIGRRGGTPVPPLNALGDLGGGGLLLAFGVLCALHERQRSGRGQVVDAAIIDGAVSFLSVCLGLGSRGLWRDAPGENFLSGAAHYYDTYETRDGKWIAVGAIEPQFHALVLRKARVSTPRSSRQGSGSGGGLTTSSSTRSGRPQGELAVAIRTHTRDELQAMFDGTDACVTPVLDIQRGGRASAPARATRLRRRRWSTCRTRRRPRFSRSPAARAARGRNRGADARRVLARGRAWRCEIAALRRCGALG